MISVRPAGPLDRDDIGALRRLLHDVSPFYEVDPKSDFLAEVDGKVLGWIQVTFDVPLVEIGQSGAWIQLVAVFPKSRGQGVGEVLVQSAVDRALAAGDRVIACQPIQDEDFERRKRFFAGLGFTDRTVLGQEAFWVKDLSS